MLGGFVSRQQQPQLEGYYDSNPGWQHSDWVLAGPQMAAFLQKFIFPLPL